MNGGGDPVNFVDPDGLTRRHWTELQGQAYEDALFRAAEVGPLALRRVENIEAGAAATEAIFALPNPLYAAGSAAFGKDIYGRRLCKEERAARVVAAGVAVALGAAGGVASAPGRTGRLVRWREVSNDPKAPSWLRGWLKHQLARRDGRFKTPPGYQLAHRRGREARRGYGYEHSDPNVIANHRLQHRHEGYR